MVPIYHKFHEIKDSESEFGLKSLLREYNIINLYNFIKIRESLLKDFALNNKRQLDTALKPFWEPIVKRKAVIEELRNAYFAHLQEENMPFERAIESILFESNFPSFWGDTVFFAGCVWGYASYVRDNFAKEWADALKKLQVLTPPISRYHGVYSEANVDEALKKVMDEVIGNLKQINLKF